MQLRYRITWLFTFLVIIILAVFGISVYCSVAVNRERLIHKRLANRALTTANLFLKVDHMDTALLNDIQESTQLSLIEKSLAIYDARHHCVYTYNDRGTPPVRVDPALLEEASRRGRVYFNEGRREAAAVTVPHAGGPFISISAAYDPDGLEHVRQMRLILLVCFLAGALITFVSGYLFALRLLYPVGRMSRQLKEISGRNLSNRLEAGSGNDELDRLALTINDLLNRLQESFGIQSRFIANASHELSTPLTSVSAQLEVALQQERSRETYTRVIRSVYEDVRQLNQLMRALLDIAAAGGTPEGLVFERVRMDELLMDLPKEIKKTDSQAAIHVQFGDFPEEEDRLTVHGSRELLLCAIRNVVTNACKFSPDKTAFIRLSFTADQIVVSVRDGGPGIPAEELPSVFQPFYRGKNGTGQAGFGLGLSLSSRILHLHKGHISVESVTGSGTTFTLVLPAVGSRA